jgi:predicted ATPase/class 3 adenylate cyclase/Tfp pilus assembly protein PilF
VTLVFADLAGALELEARRGAAFAEAAARWRESAQALVAKCGGYLVKTTAGGIMAAFAEAASAARFAAEGLLDSERFAWPGGAAPVRAGMNTGDPILERDPATGRADYFGPVVNRAARLCAAAHPGQALLSASTREAVSAPDLAITDLGEHRLRGLETAERIFQLLPKAWSERRFPPIAAAASLPTNLPPQSTSFVGREKELAELEGLLAGGARLVVLSGPAGCGKTRLAVRLASGLMAKFPGGAWIADLSEVSDMAGLAEAVALAFGVTLPATRGPAEAIGDLLELRPPTVLLLDTFDRVRGESAAAVAAWVARAPRSVFVLTTRATAGVAGEREVRVGPLGAPGEIARGPGAAGKAGASEAVRLFVDRAREARPDFRLTDENAPDVAAICTELEGLPLAVELAAARIRVISAADMVKKLGQKFQLLRTSRQDTSRRQQTLAGAIEWSWDQLSAWEQSAFLQASAFVGGFHEEAAARVLDLSAHPEAPAPGAAVRALVARSLATVVETPRGPRYAMYRPIREYAEKKRAESGAEGTAAEDRHAAWCLAEGRRLEAQRRTAGENEARDRVLAELDNVFAACDRLEVSKGADAPARARQGFSTLLTLEWLADRIGRNPGLRLRLENALVRLAELPPAPGDDALRADLHTMLGVSLWATSERTKAIPHFDQAIAASAGSGNAASMARARSGRILAHWAAGEYEEGLKLADENDRVYRDAGDKGALAKAANTRGCLHLWRGEVRPALVCLEKALALSREVGWGYGAAMVVGNMGIAYKELGNDRKAEECYREALAYAVAADFPSLRSTHLGNVAGMLSDVGRFEEALKMFDEAAEIDRKQGDKSLLARKESNKAVVLLRQGKHEEALKIFEACEKHFRDLIDHAGQTTNLSNKAAVLISMNRHEEALAPLAEAREYEVRTGDELGVAHIDSYFGRLHYERGRYDEAASRLRAAAQAGRKLGTTLNTRHMLTICLLALSEEKLGHHAEAVALAKEISPALEALTNTSHDWDESLHKYWEQTRRLIEANP